MVYIAIGAAVCLILLVVVMLSKHGDSDEPVSDEPEIAPAQTADYTPKGIEEATALARQAGDMLSNIRLPDGSIDQKKLRQVSAMLDAAVDECWRLDKQNPDNPSIQSTIKNINRMRYGVMKSKAIE